MSGPSMFPSRLRALAAAAASLTVVACSNDPVSQTGVVHPTLIEVAPETFLGDVPCVDSGPGLIRYVATLVDVTPVADSGGDSEGGAAGAGSDESPFRLPSSAPLPCRAGVGFGHVTPGRLYRAEIFGYDTARIVPLAPGSDVMVDGDPRGAVDPLANAVAPKWTAVCEAATPIKSATIRASRCSTFENAAGASAEAELRIPTESLLGALSCDDAASRIDRLTVTVTSGSFNAIQDVGCGDEALVSGVPTGERLDVYVAAYRSDEASAFAGAECYGIAIAGARVSATCSRLSEVGTLRVDLAQALTSVGVDCSTLAELEVLYPGTNTPERLAPDCSVPLDFGAPAGSAAAQITAKNDAGEPLAVLSCAAEALPGRLVATECTPLPAL